MNDNRSRAQRERDDVSVRTVPGTATVSILDHQIDQERISRRAYEIYESRHRAHGHADDDWFQAVAEYAAYCRMEPIPFAHYRGDSSFGNRIQRARR